MLLAIYWDANMLKPTKQKSNEEVDDTFHLVIVPDYFPRLNFITFCGSFLSKTMPILPDLHTQKQNKRSRVWVPEFSFCGLELKSSSKTCPRSQELRTRLSCRSMFLLLFSLSILQWRQFKAIDTAGIKAAHATVPAIFPTPIISIVIKLKIKLNWKG